MDINLYYTERGQGKPLILLHGNGEDGEYFSRQIGFFAKDYRVIALDTRGHGKSPRGTAPFTLSQFVEDLKGFMDRLSLQRASLLGFSDGGNIALLFALKYPERVERLILNGANLFPKGVKARFQIPIVLGYRLVSLIAKKDPKARKDAEMLGLMVKEPSIKPEDLTSLSLPTLVIAGTKDMIKDRHTRLIAESLPHATLAIIEGSHFIAAENPEAFNDRVLAFLSENSKEEETK